MILNNYYNMIGGLANISPSFGDTRNTDIGIKNLSGNTINVTTGWSTSFPGVLPTMVQNWSPKARLSIKVGSGTTEPDASDYSLENDITNSISNFNYSTITSADGGKLSTVITITGSNSTGSPITITEIGVIKAVEKANSGTTPDTDYTLIIRHLLETPKVIANGEGFSLTFEWVEQ